MDRKSYTHVDESLVLLVEKKKEVEFVVNIIGETMSLI